MRTDGACRRKSVCSHTVRSLLVGQATAATAQVFVGFTLIFGLFTRQREISKTLFYWNILLRGFYKCADPVVFRIKLPMSCADTHQLAWRGIGERISPLFAYVPHLEKAKTMAIGWFTA